MTLNLHGYHPMDEQRRVIQVKENPKEVSDSYLFYFTVDEINRGVAKRQHVLAHQLRKLKPDILFLQEVGGGEIQQEKNCDSFYRINAAIDLEKRLSRHRSWVACRGNLGWWTDPSTFNDRKIFTEMSGELIFDRGSNPYPLGMLMEGLAIITGPSIKVHSHYAERIRTSHERESFYFQMLKFSISSMARGWYLGVNIHAGHMIQHFEQAVAVRRFLSEFLARQPDRADFKGFIIAGDFNALLPEREVSSVPWSFDHAWQTKDGLISELLKLNLSDYKPHSRLEQNQARTRSELSVDKLFDWFSWPRHSLDGSLFEVSLNSRCLPDALMKKPFCFQKEKIDHIYVSNKSMIQSFSLLYEHHNWKNLEDTVSDHPGVFTKLKVVD